MEVFLSDEKKLNYVEYSSRLEQPRFSYRATVNYKLRANGESLLSTNTPATRRSSREAPATAPTILGEKRCSIPQTITLVRTQQSSLEPSVVVNGTTNLSPKACTSVPASAAVSTRTSRRGSFSREEDVPMTVRVRKSRDLGDLLARAKKSLGANISRFSKETTTKQRVPEGEGPKKRGRRRVRTKGSHIVSLLSPYGSQRVICAELVRAENKGSGGKRRRKRTASNATAVRTPPET